MGMERQVGCRLIFRWTLILIRGALHERLMRDE
jgi:hypothetical protein